MSSSTEKKYIPSNYYPRQSGGINHLKQQLGIIDYQQGWDNEFSEFKDVMKLIYNTESLIEKKGIDISKKLNLKPTQETINKLLKILWGGCYFGVRVVDNKTDFLYDIVNKIEERNKYSRYIKLPALVNMTPVGQIKDDSWGIQVRESMPIIDAFAGSSYNTLINRAGFAFLTSSGLIPKFEPHEMKSLTKKSYVFARDVYNKIMFEYRKRFYPLFADLQADWQNIIDYIEEGDNEYVFVDRKGNIAYK